VPPPVSLYRWDELALEKVTEMISRKIVTGEDRGVAKPADFADPFEQEEHAETDSEDREAGPLSIDRHRDQRWK